MTAFEDSAAVDGGVLDAVSVAVLIFDATAAEITVANDTLCTLSGWAESDLVGTGIRALIGDSDPNGPDAVAQFLERASKSEATVTFETSLRTADGSELPVVVDAAPLPDSETDSLLLTVYDDTRYQQVQTEAVEYQQLIDDAMLAGDLGWWEMDVQSGDVRFHPNKARILGFEADQFEHYADFTDLLHPDDYEPAMEAMRVLVRDESDRYDITYRIENTDGDYLWFHDVGRISSRTPDGEPVTITGVAIDVTTRMEYEAQLQEKSEELALLNRLLHHDIRNDMTVVNLCLELVREDLMNHLDRVERASNHALELTDSARDVVDIVTADVHDNELLPITLRTALDSEVERIRRSFDDVSIELTGDNTDVRVLANTMLSSVFGNILSNAVLHANKANVEITVDIEHEADSVVVAVADNGPGIPDELKQRVFDRGTFEVADGGTGLGLYIVQNLVDTYGGDIWIEDNEPEGSIVIVELQKAGP